MVASSLSRSRSTHAINLRGHGRSDWPGTFDWRVVEQVRPEIDDFDPRWADVVASILARTLVVAGGPSSPVPQEQVADVARVLRDGRLTTIDAGHLVHGVEPGGFIDRVSSFLNQ